MDFVFCGEIKGTKRAVTRSHVYRQETMTGMSSLVINVK